MNQNSILYFLWEYNLTDGKKHLLAAVSIENIEVTQSDLKASCEAAYRCSTVLEVWSDYLHEFSKDYAVLELLYSILVVVYFPKSSKKYH